MKLHLKLRWLFSIIFPPGKRSWCSFQRDVATGSSFHKLIKNPLPEAVVKVIKPLFDRLRKKELLASVEKCRTQNVN